jgi:hypothetical protein
MALKLVPFFLLTEAHPMCYCVWGSVGISSTPYFARSFSRRQQIVADSLNVRAGSLKTGQVVYPKVHPTLFFRSVNP